MRRLGRWIRPGHSAGATWYDSVYGARPGVYTGHYSESPYLPLWQVIVSLVPPESSVLEIGCGTGQLAELLLENGLANYVGFDFSAAAIEIARERLPGVELSVDDARTSPLVPLAADVIVCTEVLEHIAEDLAVIARIPAGIRLIATVPDFDSETHVRWFSSSSQVRKRYGPLFRSLTVSEHVLELEKGRFFLLDGVRGS